MSFIKFSEILKRIMSVFVVSLFAGVAGIINIQIFFRYVLRRPLIWTMELSQIFFIYFAVYGAALALAENAFTRVEFFVNFFSQKIRKVIEIAVHSLILLFALITAYKTEELVYHARVTNNITPALSIPMSLIYRIFQIGFYFLVFFAIVNMIKLSYEVRKGGTLS